MTRLIPRRRHALLVGIDAYPHFPQQTQLAGAKADAECLGALLIRAFGFAPADVAIITNEQATRAGIIAALDRLLARVGSGDVVWFHFSGHGSLRPAPGIRHRGDAQESILVPHDSAHDGRLPNQGISGSELHTWLRHLSTKTTRVTLVFDCCHAGSMIREDEEDVAVGTPRGRLRTLEEDLRPMPDAPRPWSTLDRALPRAGERGWLPASETYIMIAACRSDQPAREVTTFETGGTERTHGALSRALLDTLPQLPEGATYRDLRARLVASVRARYPRQRPNVEGPDERVLMRLATRPAAPTLDVLARDGQRLVLDGGIVHGVTRGSLWAVSPPGVPGTDNSVRARVTMVGGVRSDAVLLAPANETAVQVGSRATSIAPGVGSAMVVDFDVPEAHAAWMMPVVAAVDEAPSLSRGHHARQPEVVVAVVGPRKTVGPRDRAKVLGPLDRPVAVVVDTDDRLVLPVRWRLDSASRAETATALERLARHRRLSALANPQPSPLAGQVTMQLQRREPDGFLWQPASLGASDRPPRFDVGEEFAVTLTNHGTAPVYAHVLALGVGGGVGLIYPQGGACEALVPGHTVWAGDRPGGEMWFEIPDTLPFERPGERPWTGIETLLLLVAAEATDLRPLLQARYRDSVWCDPSAPHSLADHLGDILSHGYREVRTGHSPRSVAWHAETMAVQLRRS